MSVPAGRAWSAARSVWLETYGCQMNVSDSEVVASILRNAGYTTAHDAATADVLLLNTCAIRDQAEGKIWARLQRLLHEKKRAKGVGPTVGILGCMAERLKTKLLEQDGLVDIVAGPDAYRDLPNLLQAVQSGAKNAINVQLSTEETYADVKPVRADGAHSAFVTIMRGCNNMCSFCIVPFTRGRERSRPAVSILDEIRQLRDEGVKQVTLLGQNVNSYLDFGEAVRPRGAARGGGNGADAFGVYADGFKSVYKPVRNGATVFSDLLHRAAEIDPELRIRFTSPHPKDFGDDCLQAIAAHHNICKLLHMPAQSGSSACLARMQRGYSREAYDSLVQTVEAAIPGVMFSTDMIVGFCGETEADHADTMDLLERMRYPHGFLFAYSKRDKTHAARNYEDDVPADVKKRRLNEAMAVYHAGVLSRRHALVGTRQLVLVEGVYEKDKTLLTGRTDTFNRICFPATALPGYCAPATASTASSLTGGPWDRQVPSAGTYVAVDVVDATSGRLRGLGLGRTSLAEFAALHGTCNPGVVCADSAQTLATTLRAHSVSPSADLNVSL